MRCKDENKKESIVNATIGLINEIGLSETSMSKIAKRAGVSSSTIYTYFENKSDMINKLYLTVKRKMSSHMFEHIDLSSDVRAGIEKVLRNYLDFIMSSRDYYFFLQQYSHSPLIQKLSREEGSNLFLPMYKLFERGKKEKVLKNVDTDLLVIYAYAPVSQFARSCIESGSDVDNRKLNKLFEMSWDAIRR